MYTALSLCLQRFRVICHKSNPSEAWSFISESFRFGIRVPHRLLTMRSAEPCSPIVGYFTATLLIAETEAITWNLEDQGQDNPKRKGFQREV